MSSFEKSSRPDGTKCRARPLHAPPPYLLPWLPELDTDDESVFIPIAMDSDEWPPLIQHKSWTRSVPQKDFYRYCKPVEGIGSSYTPSAYHLRESVLTKRKHIREESELLGPDGHLMYPPPRRNDRKEAEEAKWAAETLEFKKASVRGIVTLRDLLSGDYDRKKKAARDRKEQRKIEKIIELEEEERMSKLEEKKYLASIAAELPMDPDSQLLILKDLTCKEFIKFSEDSLDRILYYMFEAITEDMLYAFPQEYFWCALQKVPSLWLESEVSKEIVKAAFVELLEDFDECMRFIILDYILRDPDEQKRLRIPGRPPGFHPVILVRAPVPWATPKVISFHRMSNMLFITHPTLNRLMELWKDRYDDMLILDWNRLGEKNPLPLQADVFEERVKELCMESRNILESDWLVMCADVFLEMRETWKDLVPTTTEGSLHLVEALFSCAHCAMSNQLRSLIIRSMKHIVDHMEVYWEKNVFSQYVDYLFTNKPVVSINISAGTKGMLIAKPTLLDACSLVYSLFTEILDSCKYIPRVENLLFPEMRDMDLFIYSVDVDDYEVKNIIQYASEIMHANTYGPACYLGPAYVDFLYIINGQLRQRMLAFFETDPFPLLKDFSNLLLSYDEIIDVLGDLRENVPLNLININLSEINATLRATTRSVRAYVVNYFVKDNRTKNREICDTFDEMAQRCSGPAESTSEVVSLLQYIAECRDVTMFSMREKIRATAERVMFLMDHAHLQMSVDIDNKASNTDIQLNSRVFLWPNDMEEIIFTAGAKLLLKREQCENSLKVRLKMFESRLKRLKKEMDMLKRIDPPVLNMETLLESTLIVETLHNKINEAIEESEQINEEEALLEYEPTTFAVLQNMAISIEPFDKLWHTALDFFQKYQIWYYGSFMGLDSEAIKDEVEDMWRILYKLGKGFPDSPGARHVVEATRNRVEKFRLFLPVLEAISNPGMLERHWSEVGEALGQPIVLTPDSSLSTMVELGLLKIAEKLEEISNSATKEHTLMKSLEKMKFEWEDIFFECVIYRDTECAILSGIEDIQTLLDDHILKAQAMKGSPFIKALGDSFETWEEKLLLMQEVIDAWLMCQATWMYLEPIFSSEDIMRQMPTEARNFKQVDINWRMIMKNTTVNPHVLTATDYPNILEILNKNNAILEDIQRGLNMYLEKKRLFFPRFFFLSNDELLEILSETKDPLRVQPHLKKCFEGVHRLIFNEDMEVEGMVSAEGETIMLIDKIIPAESKGLVERWLQQVERQMIESLRDVMRNAVQAYGIDDRSHWVLQWPGQIVQAGDCIHWTTETTEAIQQTALDEYYVQLDLQIAEVVTLVQGTLSLNHQITIEALIVLDVHGRDIVRLLSDYNVQTEHDFQWLSQFRYYWRENNDVDTMMVSTTVAYGFEYLGNAGRLVVTPLTDRCFRTLMGALKLFLGGAPEGPAGTGKTETCKDLAKAVAKKCVVFNCSDGLDYKALGKFFKGLAQAGAWACFDEFNRIDLEVLSVVAQQILCIQRAVGAGLKRFVFEGTELSLDPTCTVFITMNPGYAGRQELPDNLKVLFRTVAMMVPDYAMIGEITLYSNGFVQAKSLSKKIVHTYKLCSEQLSSQNHYDYGMRAVKSVLLAAGSLRRTYPDRPEAQLLLRAIIDVNLPKFLAQDVPLFEGIYSDLFPGVEVPKPDRDELLNWVAQVLAAKNLQNTPWFEEKILQVYEMILVRHGLMVVGESHGGKTCAYQSLAEGLKLLQLDYKAVLREFQVIYRIINPKAVTMGQLYGCFDPASHEWSDGVLANTFREYATTITTDRKWILFDGPVDAVWIENMNTVLDDNKKLCLMSGEIIQMTNKMNLIFEPADLEQASPATVSRCGMIYFEPKMLGWEPFKASFNNILAKKLIPEQFELTDEMMDWLIPPVLNFVTHHKRFVETSPIHLFCCYQRLLTSLMEGETQVSTLWLQCAVLFCIVWGYASSLNGDSRQLFDEYLRNLLLGIDEAYPKPKSYKLTKAQIFPERGTVFEFVLDIKASWNPWMEGATVSFPADAKVSELMVPTADSACAQYFIELFLTNNYPMVIVGPTGTGKSAVMLNYLLTLPKESYLPVVINFSARTSANTTQDLIMSKLDRRRRGVFGPTLGKKCILFVDDLGMPQREIYGAQPPQELLRQYLDHGHWSHLKDTTRLDLVDIIFTSAMGLPGGSNYVDGRLMRHLSVIGVDSFDNETLLRIFVSILDWHFAKSFPENVARLSKFMVEATTDVYRKAMATMLPTPAKCHYTFSLRDFARVVKGVLLVPASKMDEPDKLVRLWAHETYRVFYDRLIDDEDRSAMFDIIYHATYSGFRIHLDKVAQMLIPEGEDSLQDRHMRDLLFGNYINPDADPRIYDEITDLEQLSEIMNYYLDEYNAVSNAPMNLVLFRFAIEHVSRVSRVLQVPEGHCLLVGIGGSGRRSAVKLASSIAEYAQFQIEISRGYGIVDWRDDMKKLLMKAGIDGKPTVFMFSDMQVKDELFVEDINALLNTADLPNLFAADEKAEIMEKMTNAARIAGKQIETTHLALYGYFIERVKESLHVCLAMSPIGSAFRTRVRMFPSLVNCCTLDWFMAWPEDALERVALHFITPMQLGEDLTNSFVVVCQLFHTSVARSSDVMWTELGRRTYVTPTSYLELIKAFQNLYGNKVKQIVDGRDRYLIGLEKLEFAAGQVGTMQDELHALQPQLIETSAMTDKLMVIIQKDTKAARAQADLVAADEALANEAAAAAQAIKDDCESDLQEAIPALQAALSALDTLKPADITVVKSMKNPPAGVKLVMEAICVMKGVKPARILDPSGSGKQIDDYWGPSLKVLSDMKFLESLKTYNKDNIPVAAMKRIRDRFINDRDFMPEVIKNVSTACEGLCRWVRAMDVYDRVVKVVAPKQASLLEAETELAAQMAILSTKQKQLQQVMDKLQKLTDEFTVFSNKKKGLEEDIMICEKKLDRAEKLIGGLGGEKTRWSATAATLDESLGDVAGDVLIAAGAVAYLGPFPVDTRGGLVRLWNVKCLELKIPCSKHFTLWNTLGDAATARAWGLAGLPVDTFSVENGIITTYAKRWPLMIDPQGQANKWIKNMERSKNLQVIKLTDGNYMRVVENSIVLGYPVLLENVGEEIDAALNPILERSVFLQRGTLMMKLGDQLIEYNNDFKFYITTCWRNPHYLPETAVMVTLLNFMITQQGLEDQLLGTVVARDRPDLQEKKTELVVSSVKNKDMLQNIENQILTVLSSSEGNILEDETAIQILTSSKILSEDIQIKQEAAAVTEKEIDDARDLYISVSVHSAILFFCLTDLTNIDPMYQYSLNWFLYLYNNTITNAEKSDILEERLHNLNHHFTLSIYKNVCRSLFEKDKLTFSFVLCIGILRARGEIHEDLFAFLLTGGVALDNPYRNPAPEWLTDKSWSEIVRATPLTGLGKFQSSVQRNIRAWYTYYNLSRPEREPFPAPLDNLKGLERLVVLRCIRPDKIVPAIQTYIVNQLGHVFIEPPVFNLAASYADSSPWTPLVFILSAGSDPMAGLMHYGKTMGITENFLKIISLGQGQGPIASAMINKGLIEGHWIVLQNCHLAESWMMELERICDEVVVPANCHEMFRLWLTSYPSKAFPISILQNGVKMTNEAPKGLRLNMLRSYTTDPISNEAFFTSCPLISPWQRLLFGLVFFHALVQERRKYGPLGWNIPYEFNESDLRISVMQLQMFLTDYGDVPYDAIHYLTGECNYGGRVTDDKDRRLLLSLLDIVYNENTVGRSKYAFSKSGIYHVPEDTSLEGCVDYIKSLPLIPEPEVFGLHTNADITKDSQETAGILLGVLLTQTQLTSGTGGGEGSSVGDLAAEILERMPQQYDIEAVGEIYPVIYSNSMNTVLRQELIRFNRLIAVIRSTLADVGKAVIGLLALVGQLEEVHGALLTGRVPETWAAKSYPSLKPLGSYVNDLLARLKFFSDWIDNGAPNVFWLSGFFFTQSFMTGVLQNFSRGNHLPIDLVELDFLVTDYETATQYSPPFGVYIKGLFLEGARWNRTTRLLDESYAKILFDTLPITWLKPCLIAEKEGNFYNCPVYKTSERRGTLSTTGHSTNFVMFIDFPSNAPQTHWINRGVAGLCQLDD